MVPADEEARHIMENQKEEEGMDGSSIVGGDMNIA